MKSKIINTKSLDQTQKLAFEFADKIKDGGILCLYGELGSGKTSFIQGFAKGLGIKKRIISPSFIIVRQYKIEGNNSNFFYHIDLYRTENKNDLQGIGLEEILQNNKNIVAIEWAEKILDFLPKKRFDLKFKYINETTREIQIDQYE